MNRPSCTFVCPHYTQKVFGREAAFFCPKCKKWIPEFKVIQKQEMKLNMLILEGKVFSAKFAERELDNLK